MKKVKCLFVIIITIAFVCGCSSNNNKANKKIDNTNKVENTEKVDNTAPEYESNIDNSIDKNNEDKNAESSNKAESDTNSSKSNTSLPQNISTPSIPEDSYQTLTCNNYEADGDTSFNESVIVKFKNNKVYNLNISINTTIINDEIKSIYSWDDIEKEFEEEFEDYTSGDGVNVIKQSNSNSYSYFIKIEFDLNNVSKNKLEEIGFEDLLNSTATYESIKSNYQILGYTCG